MINNDNIVNMPNYNNKLLPIEQKQSQKTILADMFLQL